MKYFRLSDEKILWGISFANVQMLLATIPVYNPKSSKKDETVIAVEDLNQLKNL